MESHSAFEYHPYPSSDDEQQHIIANPATAIIVLLFPELLPKISPMGALFNPQYFFLGPCEEEAMGDNSSMMIVVLVGGVMCCGMSCVGGLAAWYIKDPTLGGLLGDPVASPYGGDGPPPPADGFFPSGYTVNKVRKPVYILDKTSFPGKVRYLAMNPLPRVDCENEPAKWAPWFDGSNLTEWGIGVNRRCKHINDDRADLYSAKWVFVPYKNNKDVESKDLFYIKLAKAPATCGGELYLTAVKPGEGPRGEGFWGLGIKTKMTGTNAQRQQWYARKKKNGFTLTVRDKSLGTSAQRKLGSSDIPADKPLAWCGQGDGPNAKHVVWTMTSTNPSATICTDRADYGDDKKAEYEA